MCKTIEKTHIATLSVLMPVYEGEEFLHETIECILNQSFSDFELIILDNQSIDNSKKIIESFSSKDKRIKYIYDHKKRNGNDCFSELAKYANGKLTIVVNDDNYLHENFFLNLVNKIKKSGAEMAVCNGWYIDKFKNKKKIFYEQQAYFQGKPNKSKIIKFFLKGDVIPIILSSIFSTHLYKSVLPYVNISAFENDADTLMGIKILSNVKIEYFKDELFFCRVYDDHKRFHNSKLPNNFLSFYLEKIKHDIKLIMYINIEIMKSKFNILNKIILIILFPFLIITKRIKNYILDKLSLIKKIYA